MKKKQGRKRKKQTKKMKGIKKNKVMRNEAPSNGSNCRSRSGIVLLVTLVLLVVLSTVGYTLSSRISARRHRNQYIIDYQKARYGCDSAVKYALATLEDITPELISRPNVPDFSDLFVLSEAEYEELLDQWTDEVQRSVTDRSKSFDAISDINDVNDVNGVTDFNEPNSPTIPGPYGPPWPLVTKLIELQIGSATVRIEIEDENAKYPLAWTLLNDKEVLQEALAGFETFCEWMDVNEVAIDSLKEQLKEISEIRPFKFEFKTIKKRVRRPISIHSKRRDRRDQYRYTTKTTSVSSQIAKQTDAFAKLFHTSLIDTEVLARPTIVSESRKESALKYMGMWASKEVNINTAPRHVLEAAFTFGGDADRIAEEIIQRRRVKPFSNISDLKEALLGYSDSIRKCEKYITTVSKLFTIRVTAVSGVAKASAVIAIMKEGNKMRKIAIISG